MKTLIPSSKYLLVFQALMIFGVMSCGKKSTASNTQQNGSENSTQGASTNSESSNKEVNSSKELEELQKNQKDIAAQNEALKAEIQNKQKQLDERNKSLEQNSTKIQALEAELTKLKQNPTSENGQGDKIAELEQKLADLEKDREALLSELGLIHEDLESQNWFDLEVVLRMGITSHFDQVTKISRNENHKPPIDNDRTITYTQHQVGLYSHIEFYYNHLKFLAKSKSVKSALQVPTSLEYAGDFCMSHGSLTRDVDTIVPYDVYEECQPYTKLSIMPTFLMDALDGIHSLQLDSSHFIAKYKKPNTSSMEPHAQTLLNLTTEDPILLPPIYFLKQKSESTQLEDLLNAELKGEVNMPKATDLKIFVGQVPLNDQTAKLGFDASKLSCSVVSWDSNSDFELGIIENPLKLTNQSKDGFELVIPQNIVEKLSIKMADPDDESELVSKYDNEIRCYYEIVREKKEAKKTFRSRMILSTQSESFYFDKD